MKRKPKGPKYWKLLPVIALVWLFPTDARAAKSWELDAVRGIKGVIVVVEDLLPSTREMGFNEEQLKNDVEIRLRLAGIQVASELRGLDYAGLYLEVQGQRVISDVDAMAVTWHLELKDNVRSSCSECTAFVESSETAMAASGRARRSDPTESSTAWPRRIGLSSTWPCCRR